MATIKELYDQLGAICVCLADTIVICEELKIYFPGGTEQGGMLRHTIDCLNSARRDIENLRG